MYGNWKSVVLRSLRFWRQYDGVGPRTGNIKVWTQEVVGSQKMVVMSGVLFERTPKEFQGE